MHQRSILPVVDWWSVHFFHFSFFVLKSEQKMAAVDRDHDNDPQEEVQTRKFGKYAQSKQPSQPKRWWMMMMIIDGIK